MCEDGEEFSITMSAPLTVIKGFIKSKWRNDGWKLLTIEQFSDFYKLTFKQYPIHRREHKLPKKYLCDSQWESDSKRLQKEIKKQKNSQDGGDFQ